MSCENFISYYYIMAEPTFKTSTTQKLEEIDKDIKSLLADTKTLKDDIHYIKISLLNGFIKKAEPEKKEPVSSSWWLLS